MTDHEQSFLDRHYFLLRRLHSLSGLVPIGAFLLLHLTTNSSIMWGRALGEGGEAAGVKAFQHEVDFIHNLPALVLMEWGVLFLPILFHIVLGIWFASSGRSNLDRYKYQSNWRYAFQRGSGYLGVLFIFMHITSLRFGLEYGGLMPTFDYAAASSSTAEHFQNGLIGRGIAFFYLVCVLGLVFHFANGLWTAGITWGLTISAGAQRRWGHICAGLGIGLSVATLLAIYGFSTLDVELAKIVENDMAIATAGH